MPPKLRLVQTPPPPQSSHELFSASIDCLRAAARLRNEAAMLMDRVRELQARAEVQTKAGESMAFQAQRALEAEMKGSLK